MRTIGIVGAVGVTMLYASGGKAEDPEGMQCREVTVVVYHGGPNWSEFRTHVGRHLDYLRKHMATRQILHAGPFSGEAGGLTLYASTDQAEVDALVRTDPLLVQKVVTHSMHAWRMCRPVDGD